MSDDFGYDAGHDGDTHDSLAHAEQDQDLNQQHNAFDSDHDQLNQHNQFDHEAAFEKDENFVDAHHVEADNPHGQHFEQDDFTKADSHEAAFASDSGESSVNAGHDSSDSELDTLRTHFEQELTTANHDFDGGHGELSAVSK
jgi:hypothetical protein